MKLISRFLLVFVILLFVGCETYTFDGDSIVEKIEKSENKDCKYRITTRAYPRAHVLYTNTKFEIGDTVKFTR